VKAGFYLYVDISGFSFSAQGVTSSTCNSYLNDLSYVITLGEGGDTPGFMYIEGTTFIAAPSSNEQAGKYQVYVRAMNPFGQSAHVSFQVEI